MSTRATIRAQSFSLLRETSGDSNFTDTQMNDFIDDAIRGAAIKIEHPRKESSGTQVNQGDGDVTLPSDAILFLNAYFGDKTVNGDWIPLAIINEEALRVFAPNWAETTTESQGRPRFLMIKSLSGGTSGSTGHLWPHASANESASGKKWWVNYVYQPAALSSDSDSPDLPLPYHDILKFYVCHLCYINLSNPTMADYMLNRFMQEHNQIKNVSVRESQEQFAFKWGIFEN